MTTITAQVATPMTTIKRAMPSPRGEINFWLKANAKRSTAHKKHEDMIKNFLKSIRIIIGFITLL